MDGDRAAYCRACQALPDPPACRGCPYEAPELLPENEPIWRLWTAAQTQWRAGPWGLIGLDYVAVEALGRWLDIELPVPGILRGIQLLESEYLAHQARSGENHG